MKFLNYISSIVLLLICLPVLSHDDEDDVDPLYELSLEELMQIQVVVTARKREEKPQTVPIPVTAISGANLGLWQIDRISDIGPHVPNMMTTYSSGTTANARVFMRGLGQGESAMPTAESAVGLYVNDAYIGRLNGNNPHLFDVSHVEVLRGPQGTLYGRNTLTGAIKVVTKEVSGENSLGLRASYGSRDLSELRLSGGGTLVDKKLFGSIAITQIDQDGFTDRYSSTGTKLADKLGDQEMQGQHGVLRYVGQDNLDARWSFYHIENDSDSAYATPMADVKNSLTGKGLYSTLTSDPQYSNTEQTGSTLSFSWSANSVDFKAITSYRQVDENSFADISGQDSWYISSNIDALQWTQEFQAIGKTAGDKLDWITGVFYLSEDNDAVSLNSLAGGAVTSLQDYTVKTNSYAVYGELNYSLTAQWNITAGGRYTVDDKSFDGSTESTGSSSWINGRADVSESFESFTPKLALDYQWDSFTLLYLSVSKGFKAGGYQGRAFSAVDLNTPYDPETVWTYELGYKADLLDKRVRLNAAYFYNEFKDIQLNSFNRNAGGGTIIQNAGESRVHGIELELSAALTEHVSVHANYATAWGEYKKLTAELDSRVDINSRLAQTPNTSGLLGIAYHRPLAAVGKLRVGLNYQRTSKLSPGSKNSDITDVPMIEVYNCYIKFTQTDDTWDIGLFGENLRDKEYHYSGFAFNSFESVFPAEPRSIKLTVNYRLL